VLRILFILLVLGWLLRVVYRLVAPILALRRQNPPDPRPRAGAQAKKPDDELADADIEEAEYEELP